jgi:hypothetical protein
MHKVDLDIIEEHRVATLMRHTLHVQQLRHYHDRNVRERSFNVGDLVLRRTKPPRECTSSPPLGKVPSS